MNLVKIRPQRTTDAKRFFEILNNNNMIYFGVRPSSFEDEKEFLLLNSNKRKNNFEHNYTILYDSIIVGAISIVINQHLKYIGEIGYFIDEIYWNKGIATEAVKLIENIGFNDLNLERIEIVTIPENIGSLKVAEKCNYQKEGLLRKRLNLFGKYYNAYLYAKIKDDL